IAVRPAFDHVASRGERTGSDLQGRFYFEGPTVVALEAVRIHVSEQAELVPAAHRTGATGFGSEVPGRAQQLGVGVADLESRQEAAAEIAQEGPLGQRVVDDAHGLAAPTPTAPGGRRRAPGGPAWVRPQHWRPLYSRRLARPPRSRPEPWPGPSDPNRRTPDRQGPVPPRSPPGRSGHSRTTPGFPRFAPHTPPPLPRACDQQVRRSPGPPQARLRRRRS